MLDSSRMQACNADVIQHGPDFDSNRLNTLLFIDQLRREQHRIQDELQRITDRMNGVIDRADYSHIDLRQTAADLQMLLNRLNELISQDHAEDIAPESARERHGNRHGRD